MNPPPNAEEPAPTGPLLRVVRGAPDETELAAVVAVLAATGGSGPADAAPAPVRAWGDRSHAVRAPLTPGASAWRRSARSR